MNPSSKIIVAAGLVVLIVIAISIFEVHSLTVPKKSVGQTTTLKKTTYQASVSNSVFATKSSASLGQYLTEPNGKALYTYNGDSNMQSKCTGACLSSWPAYIDSASGSSFPSNVSTIKRQDNGQPQYTYKSQPLYTFTGDTNTSVNGNNVNGFKLAKP